MIRPAQASDAPWIRDLWNAVIADTLITFTTQLKSSEDIGEMIARRPVLVLEGQDGFATYGPFRSGPGYARTVENTIMLSPHARGQGQGRALLEALMRKARTEGIHVMVAAISGANPDAVAFHAALGFAQVGRMPEVGNKACHRLDLVLMQKLLNGTDSRGDAG